MVRALTLKPSALEGLTKIWHQAAEQVAYVKKRHPEVTEIFGDFKFRGQGQTASTLKSSATQSLNPEPLNPSAHKGLNFEPFGNQGP